MNLDALLGVGIGALAGLFMLVGMWFVKHKPIQKWLGRNSKPKLLHEIFPEILEWKIGDRVSIEYSSFSYSYKGVSDNNEIILLRSSWIGERGSLEEFGVQLSTEGIVQFIQEGKVQHELKNTDARQRKLNIALDSSQYNKFLLAHSESLSLQVQAERLLSSGTRTA